MTTADPTVEPAAIRFTGANRDFRRLVTRGALLELMTFGFYRFWLVTDIRRHLWSNTEVDGDPLEYTGRGKELLLGFLFALAVLVPVFIGYSLLGLAAERARSFASVPLYLLLFGFGQYAIFRARRYRLTRTIWRGLRFWMTGSGWSYAWRASAWEALGVVTFGFCYPWRDAALERFKLGHTHYGRHVGWFIGRGTDLFRRVWWLWLLWLIPFLIVAGALGLMAFATYYKLQQVGWYFQTGIMLFFVGVTGIPVLPFLHAIRAAEEWRWWIAGLRVGEAGVSCDLHWSALIANSWKMIGIGLLIIALFVIVIGLVGSLLWLHGDLSDIIHLSFTALPAWAIAVLGVCYLALAQTVGIVLRIYGQQRVWQIVLATCQSDSIAGLGETTAFGAASGALGEGLADGLDVAGF